MSAVSRDLDQDGRSHGAITLELPGIKLSLAGIPALLTFATIVLTLSGIGVYLVGAKTESVATVISSLNPKIQTSTPVVKREIIAFWVPLTEDYKKNVKRLE